MIEIQAEATCDRCKKKMPCTVDADLLISKRFSGSGGAMRGLPGWFHCEGSGLIGTNNLACSEACANAIKKESNVTGEWKRCFQ